MIEVKALAGESLPSSSSSETSEDSSEIKDNFSSFASETFMTNESRHSRGDRTKRSRRKIKHLNKSNTRLAKSPTRFLSRKFSKKFDSKDGLSPILMKYNTFRSNIKVRKSILYNK
mmetsp:Transcript_23819/g.21160  ORF Transcript_23819/g.21160 Transcript_23819/m.21160 type:complete len:116 (-) Transcript_23819:247-594(-)